MAILWRLLSIGTESAGRAKYKYLMGRIYHMDDGFLREFGKSIKLSTTLDDVSGILLADM
jgi:hypothetical protein